MKAQMAQNGGETPKTDETPSETHTVQSRENRVYILSLKNLE